MSKYTTQLRYPIEQKLKELGLENEEGNWQQCYSFLGLDDYPIFDEDYRQTLNDKIIRAYYFREIGMETFALFRMYMRRTMFEIMPYYNQLYRSENLINDPMLSRDMSYTESWTRDEATERDGKTNSSSDTSNKNVYQDTPMNGLDTGAIENADYATNVTFDDSTGKVLSDSESKYTGDFEGTKTHNEKGFAESQSNLLLTYRKTFLNIDLEVIGKLDNLFMQVW